MTMLRGAVVGRLVTGVLIGATLFSIWMPGVMAGGHQAGDDDCKWGDLEVPLPGFEGQSICDVASGDNPLGQYAASIATFIIALIVAVGLIVVVLGGFRYMTAGGDASKVQQAKKIIVAALAGILLALASFVILNLISPQFTGDGQSKATPDSSLGSEIA